MRIELKREGGLAFFPGLARPRTVELQALPAEQAEALERSVQEAHFFEQPPVVGAASAGGADRTRYLVTVEEGERKHSVLLTEPVEDPHLRSLLGLLKQVELEQRRAGRSA
jgi:emfourin